MLNCLTFEFDGFIKLWEDIDLVIRNSRKLESVLRNDQCSENNIETYLSNDCCVNFKNEGEMVTEEPNSKKNKVHECPICFEILSSRQALGGHKRSHFPADMEGSSIVVIEKPI